MKNQASLAVQVRNLELPGFGWYGNEGTLRGRRGHYIAAVIFYLSRHNRRATNSGCIDMRVIEIFELGNHRAQAVIAHPSGDHYLEWLTWTFF